MIEDKLEDWLWDVQVGDMVYVSFYGATKMEKATIARAGDHARDIVLASPKGYTARITDPDVMEVIPRECDRCRGVLRHKMSC